MLVKILSLVVQPLANLMGHFDGRKRINLVRFFSLLISILCFAIRFIIYHWFHNDGDDCIYYIWIMMRSYDLSVMIMMMMMMCVCEHSVIRSQENRLNDHRQLFYCAAYYYQLSRDTLFICNGLFCICADIFFSLSI